MKQITFLRHGPLLPPYVQYDQVTFEQICDLATGKADPRIDREKTLALIKESPIAFSDTEYICCGESTRVRETAKLIQETFQLEVPLEPDALYSEIHFDPRLQTIPEKFALERMAAIRIALFQGMLTGQGTESISEILERIKLMSERLSEVRVSKALVITGSFYMRVLRLYFLDGVRNPKEITVDRLNKTLDHTNIDGFIVQI